MLQGLCTEISNWRTCSWSIKRIHVQSKSQTLGSRNFSTQAACSQPCVDPLSMWLQRSLGSATGIRSACSLSITGHLAIGALRKMNNSHKMHARQAYSNAAEPFGRLHQTLLNRMQQCIIHCSMLHLWPHRDLTCRYRHIWTIDLQDTCPIT